VDCCQYSSLENPLHLGLLNIQQNGAAGKQFLTLIVCLSCNSLVLYCCARRNLAVLNVLVTDCRSVVQCQAFVE